ncbi:calcium release-activated calcium channel protein 1-like isoform X2 [Clavelina lepadiformis]|uniref:Calcium release-activated calcium channel protein 1 n=1 Tax=Clavelina lepadiformis TaxID=159417 RepID=A0ABP0GCI6_CLALP
MENTLNARPNDDQPNFSFSSRGSSYSGWAGRDRSKMTTQWRQLYLSRAKLKAVSRTSALIAGFAMVAMVEVQLDREVQYDTILLVMFSAVTTCLVAVHLFALMIATCMLPNIEAVSNIHNVKAIIQSPHHKMRTYIEVAWILSTGLGLVLFLIEIALLIWLKFITLTPSKKCPSCNNVTTTPTPVYQPVPAWVATALLIPIVLLFAAFACHFYRTLAEHKYTIYEKDFTELEAIAKTGDLEHLHPNTAFGDGSYHVPLSRVTSGASVQSQPAAGLVRPSLEVTAPSRESSYSGQLSIDPL